MIWQILLLMAFVVAALFAFVVAFGAPFVPTLSPQIKAAVKLVDLKPGQTLLELGCGDGRVMLAAAEKGWKVIGYELNPLLVILCWLRTRKYRGQVKVVWGNFWKQDLPPADGIFVFLLNRYMERLDQKIKASNQAVKLVSFAFEVPGKKIAKQADGVFLYQY